MKRSATLLALVTVLGAIAVTAVLAQAPPTPPATTPPPDAPPAAAPTGPLVDKAEVVFDGKVKTDGVVNLVFTPQGGAPIEIRVTLQKGMKAQDISRDATKEFGVALGETCKIKDDKGKVKIEAAKKDLEFSLALGSQTATGVTVEIKLK